MNKLERLNLLNNLHSTIFILKKHQVSKHQTKDKHLHSTIFILKRMSFLVALTFLFQFTFYYIYIKTYSTFFSSIFLYIYILLYLY